VTNPIVGDGDGNLGNDATVSPHPKCIVTRQRRRQSKPEANILYGGTGVLCGRQGRPGQYTAVHEGSRYLEHWLFVQRHVDQSKPGTRGG
jgi:hypothetical protein